MFPTNSLTLKKNKSVLILHDYLYLPYKEAGGNGTITRMMNEIDRLPVRPLPREGVKFSDVQK